MDRATMPLALIDCADAKEMIRCKRYDLLAAYVSLRIAQTHEGSFEDNAKGILSRCGMSPQWVASWGVQTLALVPVLGGVRRGWQQIEKAVAKAEREAERQSGRGVKSGISRRMRRDLAVLEGKKKKKRTMVRTEREQREQEGEPPAPPVPSPFLVDTSAGRSAVRGDHATPEVPSATPHPPSQPRSGFSAQQLFYCMKCDAERQMLAPASASELACPVCGIAMNSRPGGLR